MRFEAATGNVKLCAALIDCEETSGRAIAIERLMVDQVGK
jgi:calcineurin-like phosphoesterase